MTFLDYFQQTIQPQLSAIDLFLKTEEPPYTVQAAAALLGITPGEMEGLLAQEKLSLITKGVFLRLMRRGSSPLCRMLDREIRCGSPKCYTPAAVSYIYDLDISDVLAASEKLGKSTFESGKLFELFGYIQVPDRVYRK